MNKFFSAGREAVRNLFRRPNTVLFPVDHVTTPPDLRGTPILDPGLCSLCGRCERECPTGAIEITKESKHKGTFALDLGRCCYCQVCESSCSFQAITLTDNWMTAELSKPKLLHTYQIEREET